MKREFARSVFPDMQAPEGSGGNAISGLERVSKHKGAQSRLLHADQSKVAHSPRGLPAPLILPPSYDYNQYPAQSWPLLVK